MSHGFQAPDNATLPNGLVSVEIYNKLHEAIFGYDNTPRSLQFMIPLSPDQQQYIRQYINNITSNTLSQAEMIDRTLDKGIITNIGYHNNKDVSIGIPGFVLINVETYLQSIEIGFINPSTIFTL